MSRQSKYRDDYISPGEFAATAHLVQGISSFSEARSEQARRVLIDKADPHEVAEKFSVSSQAVWNATRKMYDYILLYRNARELDRK